MRPLQPFDDRITFASYPNLKITEHILIFLNGHCVQHTMGIIPAFSGPKWYFDYSDKSGQILQTLEQIKNDDPSWKVDIWDAALWFYDHTDNLQTWLASRYEFLRDWSCDHECDPSIFATMLEMHNDNLR